MELKEEKIEETEDAELSELGELKTSAPDDVFVRLQKRMQMTQMGKDLVEKQAFAFWTVIDAFLRMFFVPEKKAEETKETGEK